MPSLAESLAKLPKEARDAALNEIAPTPEAKSALPYLWKFWARESQVEPAGESWQVWLYLAGRGSGKTRTAAEWIRQRVAQGAQRILLVGRTAGDVRDTMLFGESGLLTISPPWERPKYEPSKRLLTWPNGATALLFSADKPDQIRGQNADTIWCDELAAWRYDDAWHQLKFCIRSVKAGLLPRIMVSTTPRPTDIIKSLVKDADGEKPSTVITRGSSYENKANLAPSFLEEIKKQYEGTRLGRQEIYGELLDDNPYALWTYRNFQENRVAKRPALDEFKRIVIGIDPAVTAIEDRSDETGIIVAGLKEEHIKDSQWTRHAYILADKSGVYTPKEWAEKAIQEYRHYHADAIVCEVNNGGDLVVANIHNVNRNVRVIPVRATRGKFVRAEPAANLYEQGRVHHVGQFAELEDQMVSWDPQTSKKSPDRMDALVWALWELIIKDARGLYVGSDPRNESLEERMEREAKELLLNVTKDDWT